MKNGIHAVYNALISSGGHGAFFRHSRESAIWCVASEKLVEPKDSSEGFLIHPYHNFEKGRLIENDIEFHFDGSEIFERHKDSSFTKNFIFNFNSFNGINAEPKLLKGDADETKPSFYMASVDATVEKIRQGKLRKAVLSRIKKNSSTVNIHSLDLFISLCVEYPNAFVSLIISGELGVWVGASPELLLSQEGNTFETTALAGTRRTTDDEKFSGKEKEEQGIIALAIEEMLERKKIKFETGEMKETDTGLLSHLETKIKFETEKSDRLKILEQLHPTPAVGGYPKYEALKWIDLSEQHSRELYAGYIGTMHHDRMKVYVNIRCMQRFQNFDLLYSGAGITAMSDPEKEWIETENKIRVIESVLERKLN
jgi:isochorismate synthase